MPKIKESKIVKAYKSILSRLPTTYPQAKLIVHKTITDLRKYYEEECNGDEEGAPPYAFCNSVDNTVHVSYAFYKESIESMSWYFCHEIGHLYALQKFGESDLRWKDFELAERYANNFADRWIKKLKKEGFFKK